MAKKFSAGNCVYCLKYSEKLTSDHVFPNAWYSSDIQQNLEKWQVPSCLDCNQRYGRIENALLIKLGMGIDPNNQMTSNIAKKALRAVNTIYGKNERDKKHRFIQRIKIINNLVRRDKIKSTALLHTKSSARTDESEFVLPIAPDSLKLMGEKFIRGITYVLETRYIKPTHIIKIYIRDEQDAQPFVELIKKYGKSYSCSDGIIIERATADDDSMSGVYYIEIWGKLYFYGIVTPNPSSSVE